MTPYPPFSLIAAIENSRGLGLRGTMPWHLPPDLKHFAATTQRTTGGKPNAVIMGRLTRDSIPDKFWPLSERLNVVVTRDPEYRTSGKNVLIASSLESALLAAQAHAEAIFVIGGSQIFNLAIELPACTQLLLTRIHANYPCDTFFPRYRDRFHWHQTIASGEHRQIRYDIERWQRDEAFTAQ